MRRTASHGLSDCLRHIRRLSHTTGNLEGTTDCEVLQNYSSDGFFVGDIFSSFAPGGCKTLAKERLNTSGKAKNPLVAKETGTEDHLKH
jgi:hypothetical protein